MTLQIGIVASDGFAIVGDTWKHMPPHDRRSWFGYSGPKMLLSQSGKSIGAIARTIEISQEAVLKVFNELEGVAGDKVMQIAAIGSQIIGEYDAEFFVGFTEPTPEMYFFQKDKGVGRPRCERMYGCYPIGDAGNPAYYWVMRNCDGNHTVAEMVRVGALTVLSGGKINSAMIRDLEVATFDNRGLRIWEREQTKALKEEIEALDKRIGESLLNRNAL